MLFYSKWEWNQTGRRKGQTAAEKKRKNHRITEWLRQERTSGSVCSNASWHQATERRVPRSMSRVFWSPHRRRLHNLFGLSVLVLSHPHSTEVLPDVQREPPLFNFVPNASCPGTEHHRKEPGSILLHPSFIDINCTERTSTHHCYLGVTVVTSRNFYSQPPESYLLQVNGWWVLLR